MSPKESADRYLIYSQIALYLGILLCILLAPASLAANTGLSYFGVHKITIIPYGVGLLAAAYFILKAVEFWPGTTKPVVLRWPLKAIAFMIVGIVVTPYSVGDWFDWIHTAIGTALFSLQLLMATWLVLTLKNDWLNWLLLAIQLTGGLISLIYLAPSQGLLLQGQVLFQAAFSAILTRSVIRGFKV